MIKLRYFSEFRDCLDARYRIEIHQENNGVEWAPREVTMSASPVDIEWDDVDKIEPVQGSSATLNLISMSDREFADLYTIDPGNIRLDISRNGSLYWSGMLDPEIFEEPYSSKERYVTSLTFSDFGITSRKEWDGHGIHSLQSVIDTCIKEAGINYTSLIKYISTSLTVDGSALTLDEVFCMSDNFYDEENEPMTLREVLDEVLRPFALKITQKNGYIYLYDLNAIHAQPTQRVKWLNADASMEADAVYNNVKVTFSPYADGVLIDGTLDYDQVLKDQPVGTSGELVRTNLSGDSSEGFRIVSGTTSGKLGNMTLSNGAMVFRIDPEYSGSKAAGVAWGYRLTNSGHDDWKGQMPFNPFESTAHVLPSYCEEIIRTPRKYISADRAHKYMIRVSVDVLFDVRYNPFESTGRHNESGNWDKFQNWCNYGYIPMQLLVCDSEGTPLKRYSNDRVRRSQKPGDFSMVEWVQVLDPSLLKKHVSWLCYYDIENRTSATGFAGWQTNKHIIGQYAGGLPSVFKVRPAGEYIPIPADGGFLELRVYSGLHQIDNSDHGTVRDIYPRSRWLMYKNPKVEIVKANGRDIDKEDVEDSAWLNKGAKESLEVDTILGTMPDPVPSARGLLLDVQGQAFVQFSRAGHTDRLERLLIGTVYSQYASRKHILSGTVRLIPEFKILSDANAPGKYLFLSEIQHLREAISEIRMVQFEADSYEAIEYKDE